ncbi:GNAT family N-acetyltransferase [Geodermatophilus sp. SYSU D00710]
MMMLWNDSVSEGPDLGYGDPRYVASLAEFGDPVRLPGSGGWVLDRPVPRSQCHDLMGPYPLFACRDWSRLGGDLEDLAENFVSVVLVADPLGGADLPMLRTAFPHHVKRFKQHLVRDLTAPVSLPMHHRRQLRRAERCVDVEVCLRPLDHLDDWVDLYSHLVARHAVTGVSAFSSQSFREQLAMPNMIAVRAVRDGVTVSMALWLQAAQRAYYHLGASTSSGYEVGASYAVFAAALEHLAKRGIRHVDLGGSAGAGPHSDGLFRFKRGWANLEVPAYLCGRVLDPRRYLELSGAAHDAVGWFPAYRAPHVLRSVSG